MGDALRERVLRACASDPRTKDMNLLLGRHATQMECASLTVTEARYVVHLAHEISPPLLGNQKRKRAANRKRGLGWFHPKHCFYNSAHLMIFDDDKRLTYCEGFLVPKDGYPATHAWVTIGGKVVDLTLRATDREAGYERQQCEYFGVQIPRQLFHAMVTERAHKKFYGAFIEDRTMCSRILNALQ
jgi:hypothetical protein